MRRLSHASSATPAVAGDRPRADEILQGGAPQADRERLISYLDEFQAAAAQHLKWGSLFGLFTFVVVRLGAWVLAIGKFVHQLFFFPWATGSAAQEVIPRKKGGRGPAGWPKSIGRANRPLRKTTVERAAVELRRKVERAEVEIMPEAAPSRHGRTARRAGALAGRS